METGVGRLSLLLPIPLRFMVTVCRTACCGVEDRPLFLSAGDSWLCFELNVTLATQLSAFQVDSKQSDHLIFCEDLALFKRSDANIKYERAYISSS